MTATNYENEIKRPTSPQASVSGRVPTQLKNKSNDVDELVELRRRYENTFEEAGLGLQAKELLNLRDKGLTKPARAQTPSAPTDQPADDFGWSQSNLSSHRISALPLRVFLIR